MRRILIASVIELCFFGVAVSYYAGVRPESLVDLQPPNVPVPGADAVKFAGTYYNGDGLGVNIHLTLKPDGSYAGTWHGCGGLYGEAVGNWRVTSKTLNLSPWKETDIMVGHLRTLEIVDEQKHLVFVRPEDSGRFREKASDAGSHQMALRFYSFQRTDQMKD